MFILSKKMKLTQLPPISIIIPVFNEEKRVGNCLDSIRNQNYPQEKIEILIIDDGSSDKTIEVSQKYIVRILENGSKNIERGKSIGLAGAKNEYILFLDADNRLPHPNWLIKLVNAMESNPRAVGAQAVWFHFDNKHTVADKYCELFGINDPMAFYLNRRDRLMATEKQWALPGKIIKETNDYYLVEFNKDNLLTVGSQGFLTKKSLFFKTNWQPYLFHMDSNMDLVIQGHNQYLMIKDTIIHLHCDSIKSFIKKRQRNFTLFLKQENIRRYTWRTKPIKLILVTLSMVTLIKPSIDSLKGFVKKPDLSWFLHPIYCLYIPLLYFYYILRGFEFKKIFRGNR